MNEEQRKRFVAKTIAANPELARALGQTPEQQMAIKLGEIDQKAAKQLSKLVQERGYVTDSIRAASSVLYLELLTSTFSSDERDRLLAMYMSAAMLHKLR